MAPDPYMPVPVDAARALAVQYAKSIVIICAWDAAHGLLHVTTYGTDPQNKAFAAYGGEIAMKALGGQLDASVNFEDYRLQQAQKMLKALRDIATRGIHGEGEMPMTPSELREIAREAIAEAEKFIDDEQPHRRCPTCGR